MWYRLSLLVWICLWLAVIAALAVKRHSAELLRLVLRLDWDAMLEALLRLLLIGLSAFVAYLILLYL